MQIGDECGRRLNGLLPDSFEPAAPCVSVDRRRHRDECGDCETDAPCINSTTISPARPMEEPSQAERDRCYENGPDSTCGGCIAVIKARGAVRAKTTEYIRLEGAMTGELIQKLRRDDSIAKVFQKSHVVSLADPRVHRALQLTRHGQLRLLSEDSGQSIPTKPRGSSKAHLSGKD